MTLRVFLRDVEVLVVVQGFEIHGAAQEQTPSNYEFEPKLYVHARVNSSSNNRDDKP